MYNIEDFGANINNKNNAKYIQLAIDKAYENGGGKVIVPQGKTFVSGSIVLKDNVELYLETGSVLKASDDLDDFNLFNVKYDPNLKLDTPSFINCEYNGAPIFYFIYGKDSKNIAITGLGSIDGNETIFYGKQDKYQIDGKFYPRMPLVYLVNIKHLTITNLTFQNSAFWTLHLIGCEDVLIDGVRILNNLKLANCDGIDPDHCKDVRISNCYIRCADDGIVFKNTTGNKQYGNCENISVCNCTIISTSGAIKFGTESCNDFKNITISNCNIHSSNRGISFQLRDEGNIENIIFSNINIETRIFSEIQWWGRGEPISITAVKRFEDTNVGYIKNVRFSNINIDSENGFLIYGETQDSIKDIYFDNINIYLHKKSKWSQSVHDIRPTYHENMIKGNANLIYGRNASNINFTNFRYEFNNDIVKNFINIYDIKDCEINFIN